MEIAIEYIRFIQEERAKINRCPLEDITFFENGMAVGIPQKVVADFAFTGLNNIDFIWSDFYKEKRKQENDNARTYQKEEKETQEKR